MVSAARRGRGLLVAVVLVVIGCVLLAAADRVAAHLSEDRAETRLQQELHLAQPPHVQIDGVPFLTQLAQHRFGQVSVTADDLTVGTADDRLSLQHVALDLRQVRVTSQLSVTSVAEVTGTLTLAWPEVSRLSGRTITFDHTDTRGGWIKVTDSVDVAGRTVDVDLVARPVLDAQAAKITLADPRLTVLGGIELPARLTETLVSRYVDPIPVPMPDGISPTALTVARDGVQLTIHGKNVDLRGR